MLSGNERGGTALFVLGVLAALWIIATAEGTAVLVGVVLLLPGFIAGCVR